MNLLDSRIRVFVSAAGAILFIVIVADGLALSDFKQWKHDSILGAVTERLKTEEGFRGNPYPDTRGHATIGYGTKLPITKPEGEYLLSSRLETAQAVLRADWPPYDDQPENVKAALWDMAYVLGPLGVQRFKDMLAALEKGDYVQAAAEVLNSEFAREDPNRAKRIADRISAAQ